MSQNLEKEQAAEQPNLPWPELVRAPPLASDSEPPKLETDNVSHTHGGGRPTINRSASTPDVSHHSAAAELSQSLGPGGQKSRKKGSSICRGVHFVQGFKPAFVLENSGSVARDHLASERTFLAYVRTSLAIATTGVAFVQLFAMASTANTATSSSAVQQIRKFAHPLGATMVIVGLLVLVIGVKRYFVIQNALTKGMFPVTRFGIAGITSLLTIIIIIVFAVLVSGRN